jgi:hypothetical protein
MQPYLRFATFRESSIIPLLVVIYAFITLFGHNKSLIVTTRDQRDEMFVHISHRTWM